jgi:hypothetical protein
MVTGHGSNTIGGCNPFRLTTELKLEPMKALWGRGFGPMPRIGSPSLGWSEASGRSSLKTGLGNYETIAVRSQSTLS